VFPIEDKGRELLFGRGLSPYGDSKNSEYYSVDIGGQQTLGAKVQGREGNSPDHQLRSRSGISVTKNVKQCRQSRDGPGSSHSLKKESQIIDRAVLYR